MECLRSRQGQRRRAGPCHEQRVHLNDGSVTQQAQGLAARHKLTAKLDDASNVHPWTKRLRRRGLTSAYLTPVTHTRPLPCKDTITLVQLGSEC